ncbi:MAG: hypothetical protein IJG84_19410, partial [Kiritimatiellae bacterium]|nr:hypothetical protein [Kiritimatiellia bacterium]
VFYGIMELNARPLPGEGSKAFAPPINHSQSLWALNTSEKLVYFWKRHRPESRAIDNSTVVLVCYEGNLAN